MTSPAAKTSTGAYSIKPFRDALRIAAKRKLDDRAQGKTKLDKIATKLIATAMEGDVPAIKEVADRLDGKVPQGIVGGGDEDSPVHVVHEIRRTIIKPPT